MAYGSQGIQGQDIIPRELLDDYAELFSNWRSFAEIAWPGIKGVSPPGRALPPPGRALLKRQSAEPRWEDLNHKALRSGLAAPARGRARPCVARGGWRGTVRCSAPYGRGGGRGVP